MDGQTAPREGESIVTLPAAEVDHVAPGLCLHLQEERVAEICLWRVRTRGASPAMPLVPEALLGGHVDHRVGHSHHLDRRNRTVRPRTGEVIDRGADVGEVRE